MEIRLLRAGNVTYLVDNPEPGRNYEGEYVLCADVARLVEAVKGAISSGEYVVKIVESDCEAGVSPDPFKKSMPHAVLAHCYAAMSFLPDARKALAALKNSEHQA